jgi:hypothetical protein
MTQLSVVVRVLFAADQRWPTSVKGFNLEGGRLTLDLDADIGTITIVFREQNENFHIESTSFKPREEKQ